MLLMAVCAATDKANGPPPAGLVPLVVFILFIGLGVSLGMNTAFGVNPVSRKNVIRHLQTYLFYSPPMSRLVI